MQTMQQLTVRDVMTKNVLTIDAERNLNLAAQMMLWGGFRHLPVVEDGVVVGMLCRQDISKATCQWNNSTVGAVMSRDVETARSDEPLSVVAERMSAARLDSVPVVDDGALVGILTSTDVLGHVGRRKAATPVSKRHVRDVMCTKVRRLLPTATLGDAVKVMVSGQLRHVPIVGSDGKLVGMVSDRDVRTVVGDPVATLREGSAVLAQPIEEVMSHAPIAVHMDDSISALAWPLVEERVGAVPVVDDADRLVGIVSYVDVLHASPLRPRDAERYLEEVFATLDAIDFSRDILEGASGLDALVLPAGAGWSDLGTEERMVEHLRGPRGAATRLRKSSPPARTQACVA